jgi:hypothetical protein
VDHGREVNLRGVKLGLLFAGVLAAAAFAPACSSDPENEEENATEENLAEADGLFGDDRVADVLKKDLTKVPNSFQQAEKLFKIGRSCGRTDSKEIFVVEEAQTRGASGTSKTTTILPRAVVSGCNTPDVKPPPGVSDPQWGSYSLFAALFSDPDTEAGKKGDTMVFDRKNRDPLTLSPTARLTLATNNRPRKKVDSTSPICEPMRTKRSRSARGRYLATKRWMRSSSNSRK